MKTTRIVVRGYHCDSYGHVNNARYLEFYEDARWNFLEPAIKDGFFENLGLLFVVAHLQVSYKKPLLPNQEIRVSVDGAVFNNSSVVFEQRITGNDGAVFSSALVTFVLLDKETQRPVPISESIKLRFEDLLKEK